MAHVVPRMLKLCGQTPADLLEILAYLTPSYARAHSVDAHAGEHGYGARRGPKVGATGAPLGTVPQDPAPVVV